MLLRSKSFSDQRFGQSEWVALRQLDPQLASAPAKFPAACKRLAKAFLRAKARLDVAGHRQFLAETADLTVVGDLPDLRGTEYQADLRRVPAMDRTEELRMARRLEFAKFLLRFAFAKAGLPKSIDVAAMRESEARELLAQTKLRRSADRAWLANLLGDYRDLRNLFVEGGLYIVLTTVHRYRGLGVDTADLIQEGNESLFAAIDGFDWRREVRFRTYAQFWVQQAVLKTLYNSSRTVRLPVWLQKLLGKIRRTQQRLQREGKHCNAAAIGAELGLPAARVEQILATRRYAVSLDASLPGEETQSLAATLADERLEPIPESIAEGDLHQTLHEVLAELPAREQLVLRRRFGLDGGEEEPLADIAQDLGVSAERVRQLQVAALARMQRPERLRRLQSFSR